MKEIENLCGVHITAACKRLASEAPAFMVFNGVRVESKVGDTPGDLEAGWFIAKQGWPKYVEAMTRRTSESSTRRSAG